MENNTTGLKLGLNECDNATYHADRQYLSSSVLKTIYKSLDEYYNEYILGNKKQMSNVPALQEGSLAHTLLLEPHLKDQEYIFYPGWNKAGKEWNEFLTTVKPEDKRTIISAPQLNRVERLVKAYEAHDVAKSLLSGGVSEQTICEVIQGINIKTRFDYVNVDKGYILDVKTTGYSGDLQSFKATCEGLMYELSAALYLTVAEKFYNKPFDFYFLVLSKKDFSCDVYKTSYNTRIRGMQKVNIAIEKYKKALETGIWKEDSQSSQENDLSNYEIQEI